MDIKLYAPCNTKGCPHKFEAVGQPKGAPPVGKPKGDQVVLLTCPRCGTTQEIPVKEFKVPVVEAPAVPAAEQDPPGGGESDKNPPAQ